MLLVLQSSLAYSWRLGMVKVENVSFDEGGELVYITFDKNVAELSGCEVVPDNNFVAVLSLDNNLPGVEQMVAMAMSAVNRGITLDAGSSNDGCSEHNGNFTDLEYVRFENYRQPEG